MAALWRDNYGFRVCGALWLVQWDPLEDRRHAPSSRWNLLVMCRRKMWSLPRAAGWITSRTVSPRFYQMYSFLWLAWDHSTTRPAKKRLCPDTESLPSGPLGPCWMRNIVKRHFRHLGDGEYLGCELVSAADADCERTRLHKVELKPHTNIHSQIL